MDLNKALAPLYRLSAVMGMAPYSINKNTAKFEHSKTILIYCICISTYFFVTINIFLPSLISLVVRRLMDNVSVLREYSGLLMFFISHIICFTYRVDKLEIIDELSRIGQALGVSVKTILRIRRAIKVQFACCSAFLAVSYVVYYIAVPDFPYKFFYFLIHFPQDFCNDIAQLHFISLVATISTLHQSYNAFVDKMTLKIHQRTNKTHHKRPSLIVDLDSIHCNLIEVTRKVNAMHGLQNAAIVLMTFLHLIQSCYYSAILATGLTSEETALPKLLVVPLYATTLKAVICLGITVGHCVRVLTEAEKLAYTVSKLQTTGSTAEIRSQMNVFSSQLLHRKVHFSACGFFPIDATLLYSIVGGVTTYLVILIQFRQSEMH